MEFGHVEREEPVASERQSRLLRAKNFLDLNDQTQDINRHQLQLDYTHPSSTNFSLDDDQALDESLNEQQPRCGYVNIEPDSRANHLESSPSSTRMAPLIEESDDELAAAAAADYYNEESAFGGGDDDNEEQDDNKNQEEKLAVLRNLLQIERQQNDERKTNNTLMQRYIDQLESEYLTLQQDLIGALKLAQKIRAHKEAQLSIQEATMAEKERMIEKLREQLDQMSESNLRQEFKEKQDKQNELTRLEKQQLKDQIELCEQKLTHERTSNSMLVQKLQAQLEEQLKLHQTELAQSGDKLRKLELELGRLLEEPKNEIIRELKEDKSKLGVKLDELNLLLEENGSKYELLRKRCETLVADQEHLEQNNQLEVERMEEQQEEQRQTISSLRMELKSKEDLIGELQFNLQRGERRLKNLLGSLRGKEATFKELLRQLELKHEQELEKCQNRLNNLERKLIEQESELQRKQNDLVRLGLEQENQNESIRTDRDQRLLKIGQEKEKLEREMQLLELKLARELEDKDLKVKRIDQLQNESKQFKEESRRLSLELTKCVAQLHQKQQELREHQSLTSHQHHPTMTNSNLIRSGSMQSVQSSTNSCSTLHTINNNNNNECSLVLEQQYELDKSRRQVRRLETTVQELRVENEKLVMKIRVNEENLIRINKAISRERAKMVLEYESRIEKFKGELGVYEKEKLRYKRYGYKLKKYCDHLRLVHEHLCKPDSCGYSVSYGHLGASSTTTTTTTSETPKKGTGCKGSNLKRVRSTKRTHSSKILFPPEFDQDDDEEEMYYLDSDSSQAENTNAHPYYYYNHLKSPSISANPRAARKRRGHSKGEKFSIKRTGGYTKDTTEARSDSMEKSLGSGSPIKRSILKNSNWHNRQSSKAEQQTQDQQYLSCSPSQSEHTYCYIDRDEN